MLRTVPSGFERDTAVVRREGAASTYDARFSAGWHNGIGICGGMVMATVGRALGVELTAHGSRSAPADPCAISAQFLSPATAGPATVHTSVLRRGRGLSTGSASVVQLDDDGVAVERLRALAACGDLDTAELGAGASPPDLPAPERCIGLEMAPPAILRGSPMLDRVEHRLDPASVRHLCGAPSGRGRIQGWLRLPGGHEPDPLTLLLAVDSLPLVSFNAGETSDAVAAVELTAYVRGRPAPGWLRLSHVVRDCGEGYVEQDSEVWDSADRMVAQSRQLARITAPVLV
jgi:hypothetical protein